MLTPPDVCRFGRHLPSTKIETSHLRPLKLTVQLHHNLTAKSRIHIVALSPCTQTNTCTQTYIQTHTDTQRGTLMDTSSVHGNGLVEWGQTMELHRGMVKTFGSQIFITHRLIHTCTEEHRVTHIQKPCKCTHRNNHNHTETCFPTVQNPQSYTKMKTTIWDVHGIGHLLLPSD